MTAKLRLLLGSLAALVILSLIALGALKEAGVWSADSAPAASKSAAVVTTTNAAPAAASNPVTTAAAAASAPQLSKEYVYAGGRMLAVEDAAAASAQTQPADLVVWRPTGGIWYIRDSTNGTISAGYFGQAGDKPVPADWDGDGRFDFGVFRPNKDNKLGYWYGLTNSNNPQQVNWMQFGLFDDIPVPADYDGDGRADVAVYRPSNGVFYIWQSSNNQFVAITVSPGGADVPIPADYDGDGKTDAAVYRPSTGTWLIFQSASQTMRIEAFGQANETPVVGDFDGDGRCDLAVMRTSSNQWIYKASGGNGQTNSISLAMQAGDVAVAGDYDGDGKTDAAVWRPSSGVWYIQQSASGQLRADQWGTSGDTPVPAPMTR